MNNRTNAYTAVRSILVLAMVLTMGTAVLAQSTQPTEEKPPTAAATMERCQEMKEQKQKLKEDMKAQDAQLTEQLLEMNRAPKDKKVGLMATALTGMVQQRIAMDARKAQMEESMMQHMMQHMQMGKEAMSQCPMMKDMHGMGDMKGMKGMKGMDAKPGDAPTEQQ